MGIYVNPTNDNFKGDVNSKIYVDKTMMLARLNERIGTRDKFLCVSRPRRFGKTMAGNMISAYYGRACDSSGLFNGLNISSHSSFQEHFGKYNVLKLDIGGFWSRFKENAIKGMAREVVSDFKKEFRGVDFSGSCDIAGCILAVAVETGIKFVVVLDEYDVLMRDDGVSEALLEEYLEFLNGLFKNDAVIPHIALAYLTGILPIIREKAQSKLNNFREYTILNSGDLSQCVGFTAEEVERLCKTYGMSFEECKAWYDGYRLGGFEIYDPKSVVMAMESGEFAEYWNLTSSYDAVSNLVEMNFEGISDDVERMLSGGLAAANTTEFNNVSTSIRSKDDVFTYLCHLGYLAYDRESKSCRIPNHEVRLEWIKAIRHSDDYKETYSIIRQSENLLKSVWESDGAAVARALDVAHRRITSPLSYNNEQSLQSAIRLAFLHAENFYTIVMEYPAGDGYADIAFIPYKANIPAMLVELKVKGNVKTAMDQIRSKKYFAGLEKWEGNLLLVGISYDRKTKKHECLIERA